MFFFWGGGGGKAEGEVKEGYGLEESKYEYTMVLSLSCGVL